MMDSHEDLGINAKKRDRLEYGYTLTCAPVEQQRLDKTVINTTITTWEQINYTTVSYNLSQTLGFGDVVGVSNLSRPLGGTDYHVKSFQGFYGTSSDPALIVIDKGSILYSAPNNGPVFATESTPTDHDELAGELYRPLELASLIGCVETYQLCNPTNAKCTPWSGQYYFTDSLPLSLGSTSPS